MAKEINRYRLNYMNAYVKCYDDGSEILMSYSTDVVKRTPSGKYIRLWSGWSASTNKQVRTYCGQYFRGLPYADGTYEDLKKEYKRKGYNFNGGASYMTINEVKSRINSICYDLKRKNLRWLVMHDYNSACNKELKKWAKSEKRKRLVDALYSCATKKPTRNAIGALAKMYNFDIAELWKNSLIKDFGPMENAN